MIHYSLLEMGDSSVRNRMSLVCHVRYRFCKNVPQHTTVCTSSTAACPGDSVWPIKTFTCFVWYKEIIFESCHRRVQAFYCDWKGHVFLMECEWTPEGLSWWALWPLWGTHPCHSGEESGHTFIWSCPGPLELSFPRIDGWLLPRPYPTFCAPSPTWLCQAG